MGDKVKQLEVSDTQFATPAKNTKIVCKATSKGSQKREVNPEPKWTSYINFSKRY